MRKTFLLTGAILLMLGVGGCTKPDVQEIAGGNGETQYVKLTTSFDDGSKLNVNEATGQLNLSWQPNVDHISVYSSSSGDTPIGDLLCTSVSDGGKTGTFEGSITESSGVLTFRYGTMPNYTSQDGGAIISSKICLEGTSEYKPSASDYSVSMRLPYAILKLDLSALGTASPGTTVTISAGGSQIASVSNVTTSSKTVYVAMPADNTSTDYTFTGNGKSFYRTWEIMANSFYTADNGSGGGTGAAIVIEPLYLPGVFTVGETSKGDPIKVKFSRGNLYWNGSAFKMEANQWGFQPTSGDTWNASHVSHFYWSATASIAYAQDYYDPSASTDDDFFANTSLKVEGQTGWNTLHASQWSYVLNQSGSYGRTDENRFAKAMIHGVVGLVVFPDGYSLPSGYTSSGGTGMSAINSTNADFPTVSIIEATWTAMESAGTVFLPAAGDRNGTSVGNVGIGLYWSNSSFLEYVYVMLFNSSLVDVYDDYRNSCYLVRLVRSAS